MSKKSMTLYRNCEVETFFAKNEPSSNAKCEVRIEGTQISVAYNGERGRECYVGADEGGGHYRLQCPEVKGRATLHRLKDGEYLEGFWSQEGYYGMWRIQIIDEN